jgi:hypothetical protein
VNSSEGAGLFRLGSGSPGGLHLPNAAGLRNAVLRLFEPLCEGGKLQLCRLALVCAQPSTARLYSARAALSFASICF